MSYTLTTKNSPNYYATNNPTMIIIHHWGSDGQSFDGVVNWLCNTASGVSAHYVVQSGKVAKLLPHSRGGWHCVGKNTVSIGIECRPEMSDGDFKTVAELIANIWKEEGKILPLKGHRDYNSTACPGRYYSKLKELHQLALTYYNGKTTTTTPVSNVATSSKLVVDGYLGELSVTALQKWINSPYKDGEISGQLVDLYKYYPNLTSVSFEGGGSATVSALQKYLTGKGFKCEVDGYLGKETITALQKLLNKNGASITADGILGPDTAKALQQFLNAQK